MLLSGLPSIGIKYTLKKLLTLLHLTNLFAIFTTFCKIYAGMFIIQCVLCRTETI
ncbi:hypothetical protein NP493_2534g00000 [Ridgeia piscesae]|uniref:Uncharacterized protein n=1 Tax=Ridgeia piscesae TaxID=27915 RepID=A0AAD9JFN2_RIDPI|nr:hypothetical protein NP493_2534g00000 [Ridgeia piscesae]